MQRQVNLSSCKQDKKGERTGKMFQTGKHEFIPSIPIMCTYRQLLAALLLILCALITALCLAAAIGSLSGSRFTPWLSELDGFLFCCCFCPFCTELTQSPVWPWDTNDTTCTSACLLLCFLCACVCAFTLRLATSLLPQPPVTDHQ